MNAFNNIVNNIENIKNDVESVNKSIINNPNLSITPKNTTEPNKSSLITSPNVSNLGNKLADYIEIENDDLG